MRFFVATLFCALIVPLSAGAQITDPTTGLDPRIEKPVREGTEVVLKGTATPGTRVVAKIAEEEFVTTADEFGSWWLKFSPGGAREVELHVGNFQKRLTLSAGPAKVTITPTPLKGPVIEVQGTAPDSTVVTLMTDERVLGRTQPTDGHWSISATLEDATPLVKVIATDAAGEVVASKDLPVAWGKVPLDVAYPKDGKIAAPFAVRGTTTPNARVTVRYGGREVTGLANTEGGFSINVPPPKRGQLELRVSVGGDSERYSEQTIQLEVVNRLKPPVASIIVGNVLGTALGIVSGVGFGYGLGGLLYNCTNNCAVDVEGVQISAAIWGANWGALAVGSMGMHMMAGFSGYRGSYAMGAGVYGAAMMFSWAIGTAVLDSASPVDVELVSAGITGVGAMLGILSSSIAYSIRGDQTRRRIRQGRVQIFPTGNGIAGSW